MNQGRFLGGALVLRGLLTGKEWAFFEPCVVETDPFRGRPRVDHRRVLDAASWETSTGIPWHDLPPEMDNWNSFHRQYRHWTSVGPVGCAVASPNRRRRRRRRLADDRQHHRPGRPLRGGRKRGTYRQALGRSRGGFSTKIHLRTNAHGLPIGLTLTPGEAHDSTACAELMDERDSEPGILLADRGHDSDAIRQDVRDRGGRPEIPTKRNRRVQYGVQQPVYTLHNRIERCINRVKNRRRIATRYDHTPSSFLGFIQLAIRIWISVVLAT